ncbi:hypothetical protein [Clostridium perfringens]|uniref:hypothetical protein n=1 Tax=Clostridium perfringens TaxID=1502 RepID=UPI000707E95E|nr:hypothetical protein [Clostridium perfringens]AQW26783.1 hypothetical protein BXT94_08395 [Clostridium perfringens]KAB8120581.1 hypothetical protein FVB38_05795 [Clostridium perfringens]KQC91153.1 hypothetical protein AM596_16180 [Clostridium perfringens CP4]MBO3435695.1 hypothetical protein [Clostridium perfringens]PWX15097.1 hypothetical protein CYK69_00015 [Clostridium perfringens]
MSLRKNIKLTVKDYDIFLSSPLKFWQYDILTLTFEIEEFGIEISNGIKTRVITPINSLSAIILIENPNQQDIVEAVQIVENKVTFKLKKEHTKNLGITKLQIKLKDSDGCKVTLPPFDMEIREPIGIENGDVARCGKFLTNELTVGEGLSEEELKQNSELELVDWQDNITPVSANNLNAFKKKIKANESAINSIINKVNILKDNLNKNKINIFKGQFLASEGQNNFDIPHEVLTNDILLIYFNGLNLQKDINYSISNKTITTPTLTKGDEISWILIKNGILQ